MRLRDATLFHTLADTGMRPSEALGLQWSDINIAARTVLVERAVTLGRQLKSTKTESRRQVPLTEPLVEALKVWQRQAERRRQVSGKSARRLKSLVGGPGFKVYTRSRKSLPTIARAQ